MSDTKGSEAAALPLSLEFAEADFGDVRLNRRLEKVLDAAVQDPGASFPRQGGSESAAEGTYRLLGNPKVTPEAILAPHYACTVGRAADAGLVLVLHDTTELQFNRESDDLGWLTTCKTGFLGHFSLAVSADGLRRPPGLLGLNPLFRERPDGQPKKAFKKGGDVNGEANTRRWIDQALEASALLDGRAASIHVMDREADAYGILSLLVQSGQHFIVRAHHDRVLGSRARRRQGCLTAWRNPRRRSSARFGYPSGQ